MESNERIELTSKTETDSRIESRLTALGWGWGVEGSSKNRKGLTDTDNSVVTGRVEGRGQVEVEEGVREINGNGNK